MVALYILLKWQRKFLELWYGHISFVLQTRFDTVQESWITLTQRNWCLFTFGFFFLHVFFSLLFILLAFLLFVWSNLPAIHFIIISLVIPFALILLKKQWIAVIDFNFFFSFCSLVLFYLRADIEMLSWGIFIIETRPNKEIKQ